MIAKSSGWDYKHFKLKIVTIIIVIFYMREIASKSVEPDG